MVIKEERVMTIKRLSTVGVALLMVGAASAFAQVPRAGRQGSPAYDVKTETTIKGTVEAVESIAGSGGRGRRGLGGTHLVVKTETGKLEVHMGPTAYLAENHIAIAKGDSVEILGSRVTIDEQSVLIARQIRKGDQTWTLRDASGRPMWSGGRRSQ
jgi:DNA/RNA endonuclease YhcR with UshA esterase domain